MRLVGFVKFVTLFVEGNPQKAHPNHYGVVSVVDGQQFNGPNPILFSPQYSDAPYRTLHAFTRNKKTAHKERLSYYLSVALTFSFP